jgi:hypothetical protein
MKWKTNRCHYFNFIHISTHLYMFRAYRPILHTEHEARTVQPLNQWLCEQLCEFSCGWACRPEICRDPSIYEQNWNSDICWFFISYVHKLQQRLKFYYFFFNSWFQNPGRIWGFVWRGRIQWTCKWRVLQIPWTEMSLLATRILTVRLSYHRNYY